jgi:hypothetical protein
MLGIKGHTKDLIDSQSNEVWFDAQNANPLTRRSMGRDTFRGVGERVAYTLFNSKFTIKIIAISAYIDWTRGRFLFKLQPLHAHGTRPLKYYQLRCATQLFVQPRSHVEDYHV